MKTHTKVWTEAELMALPNDGRKYELVEGEIKVSPAGGWRHGDIAALLITELTIYARRTKLGSVFEGQTGWWMKSGNLLSPDVSFLARERYAGKPQEEGFMRGSPDLAIEVLSPGNSKSEISENSASILKTAQSWHGWSTHGPRVSTSMVVPPKL